MRLYTPSLLCLMVISVIGAAEPEAGQGASRRVSPLTPGEEEAANAVKATVYQTFSKDDQAGFVRMGLPRDGEWLAFNKEFPQTVERYAAIDVRSRPTKERRTIVLQPLGDFDQEKKELLEVLRAYAEVFFKLPARVAEPIELKVNDPTLEFIRQIPMGHRHGAYYRQFNASVILKEILAKRVPDDAVLYMGVTCEDLWVGRLNYLFGLGSFDEPAAVMSLCRYYPEFNGGTRVEGDDVRILQRALKILNHEGSHVFGLHHCVFYQCTMNGCNTLGELDRAPIFLCPVCHQKLRWALKWNATARYEDLSAFYRKNGLDGDDRWLGERLRNWRLVERNEVAQHGQDDE